VRFVYDRRDERVVFADVQQNSRFRAAAPAELADIGDSLRNGNEEALDDPDAWGLSATDELPPWVSRAGS
jgi:hypothetical protein